MMLAKEKRLKNEITKLLELHSGGELSLEETTSKLFQLIKGSIPEKTIDLSAFDVDEDLFSEVKDYIKGRKEIRTSDLQRRFRLGYAKSRGIIDRLEEEGLI